MHCSHSQHLETQNPEALRSNNLLRLWTQINRIPSSHETSHNDSLSCTCDRFVAAGPSCHSFFAKQHSVAHHSDAKQTLIDTHSFDRCSLSFLHAHKSKAQTLQISHHSSASPSITIASRDYTAAQQDTGAVEEINNKLSNSQPNNKREHHQTNNPECCPRLPILLFIKIATASLQKFQLFPPWLPAQAFPCTVTSFTSQNHKIAAFIKSIFRRV